MGWSGTAMLVDLGGGKMLVDKMDGEWLLFAVGGWLSLWLFSLMVVETRIVRRSC